MTSCDNLKPAGFWTTFKQDKIQSQKSDQGPWGGFEEISWKENLSGEFSIKEILDFANAKDWRLVDSLSISKHDSIAITPKINMDDYSVEILLDRIKNALSWNEFKIYRFKTGWIKVEPGNARETDITGILAVKRDNKEIYVYHFWGE